MSTIVCEADSETRPGEPSTSGDSGVECGYCGYRLHRSERKHPRVVFCGECGWNAVEPSRLEAHSRSCHPQLPQRFYYCQHCEYRVEASSLWRAADSAGAERPYECGECDYRARTSTALNYHLRAKHSSERPYKCPHCAYAGVQSSSLKSHLLTRHNSGERNLSCPSCEFRASIPSVLRKHLERKHRGAVGRGRRGRGAPPQRRKLGVLQGSGLPAPRPPDVAEYLQMPSFGLFEAIYESQGLSPDKLSQTHSRAIAIDD